MKHRHLILLLLATLFSLSLYATIPEGDDFVIPEGYYDQANGTKNADLKSTLSQIIRKHTVLSYGDGDNSTWYCFYYSDRDTATNLCMDMYCDDWEPFTTPGVKVNGCNVEHSFAKSWWGGDKNDAYKDCYHLNPSNSVANSSRGNYPPGIPTQDLKSNTGSLRVGKATYEGQTFWVFEPKDEYKGDFARAYFYMATCYGDELTWRLDNNDVGSKFAMRAPDDANEYLEFKDWLADLLIEWHRADPVSTKEINRAAAVYHFQHNRNPFIDYPCLAEYIWGNRKGESVELSMLTSSLDPMFEIGACDGCEPQFSSTAIVSPRNDVFVGTAEIGKSTSQTVRVKGYKLLGDIQLTLSGEASAMFSLSATSISKADAETGQNIVITYAPTRSGTHTAALTLASDGAENVSIKLTGTVIEPHTVMFSCDGNCSVTSLSETAYGAGVQLPTAADLLCDGKKWQFYGWSTTQIRSSQEMAAATILTSGTHYQPESDVTLYAVYAHTEQNDVVEQTIDITAEKFGLTTSYSEKSLTENGCTFTVDKGYLNNNVNIQMNSGKGSGILYNTTPMNLKTLQVNVASGDKEYTIYEGNTEKPATILGTGTASKLFEFSQGSTYFSLKVSGASYFSSLRVVYVDSGLATEYSSMPCGATSVVETQMGAPLHFVSDGQLHLVGLPTGCSIAVCDLLGRKIAERTHCTETESFALGGGIYIVRILANGQANTLKIVL